MKTITATELARNLRQVLDRLAAGGEEIVIERNHQMVARILPGTARQTALEAMADLYRTLPEEAAAGWLESGRQAFGSQLDKDLRDPWVS
jgi:antitoxin (DNA-binding transcriptional repressor) of toxin-antitoxin stability system